MGGKNTGPVRNRRGDEETDEYFTDNLKPKDRNPKTDEAPLISSIRNATFGGLNCCDQLMEMMTTSDRRIVFVLLTFRLLNSFIVQTFFVPDEYWQSTEVAHRAVYGYGHLTWEWREGLRSYLYPFCFACYFRLLKFLVLEHRLLIIMGPRVLQAILAAMGDLFTYKTALKLSSDHSAARWTLLCQLTSWYLFYSSTRTLSNSTEASLVAIALYFFPWTRRESGSSSITIFVAIACMSIILRPTALIIWMPVVLWQLKLSIERGHFWITIKTWMVTVLISVAAASLVDLHFHGQFVNVYYNFFKFNVLSGFANIYGVHPWHWYLLQGFPVLFFTHTIFFLVAILKWCQPLFICITMWTILTYSCLPHKEFRFLSGIIPFVILLCGMTISSLFGNAQPSTKIRCHQQTSDAKKKRDELEPRKHLSILWSPYTKHFVALALIFLNIPLAMYACLVHQRGTMDIISFISTQASQNNDYSVLFLLPCHSTPYFSYVHKNISMRFLTCEPNLGFQQNYVDEADSFFFDPHAWVNKQNWPIGTPSKDAEYAETPTHLIMFEKLFRTLSPTLTQYGFNNYVRFFHTHFPTGRLDNYLLAVSK